MYYHILTKDDKNLGSFCMQKLIADCSSYNMGSFKCYCQAELLPFMAKSIVYYALTQCTQKIHDVPDRATGKDAIKARLAANKFVLSNNGSKFEPNEFSLAYLITELFKELGATEQIISTVGWTGNSNFQIRCYTMTKHPRYWKVWPEDMEFYIRPHQIDGKPLPTAIRTFPSCLIKQGGEW